jgi:hypothetical protein
MFRNVLLISLCVSTFALASEVAPIRAVADKKVLEENAEAAKDDLQCFTNQAHIVLARLAAETPAQASAGNSPDPVRALAVATAVVLWLIIWW